MKKLKTIDDITYKSFKKAEPYLKDVENISTNDMTKVVSLIYEVEETYLKERHLAFTTTHFNLFLTLMGSPTELVIKLESDGVKYGFIPNFSEITTGELIDLDNLLIDKNFEGIASILYRPIINESKAGKYEVAPYSGFDEKLFENASIRFYLGFIDFFFKSYQILNKVSPTSTNKT